MLIDTVVCPVALKLTHVVVCVIILLRKGNLTHRTQFAEFPMLVVRIVA
jgi:hypothetical protein